MPSGSLTNYAIKENVILYSVRKNDLGNIESIQIRFHKKYLYQWGTG